MDRDANGETRALPVRLLGKAEAEAWASDALSSRPGLSPNSPWAQKQDHLLCPATKNAPEAIYVCALTQTVV